LISSGFNGARLDYLNKIRLADLKVGKGHIILPFETRFFSQIVTIERSCFQNPYSPDYLKLLALRYPELFLTAVSNDYVLGYVVAFAVGKQGHIVSLAVRPGHRRMGVGTGLLESLLERLRSNGVDEVFLEVREDNLVAAGLYRKLGFREFSRIARYYEDGCAATVFEKLL